MFSFTIIIQHCMPTYIIVTNYNIVNIVSCPLMTTDTDTDTDTGTVQATHHTERPKRDRGQLEQ
jgi:hypothetical protein